MNAYSSLAKGSRDSGLERRLRSRAFRTGLAEGFAAPTLFFAPRQYRYTMTVDATVANAWEAVTQALETAWQGEAKRIGKPSCKTDAICKN